MEADFVHFAVEHIQHYMTTPNGEEQADISVGCWCSLYSQLLHSLIDPAWLCGQRAAD